MAKKNFYSIRNGRKIGIVETWPECLERVNRYPNAQYKGFSTYEEAQDYLNDFKIDIKFKDEGYDKLIKLYD